MGYDLIVKSSPVRAVPMEQPVAESPNKAVGKRVVRVMELEHMLRNVMSMLANSVVLTSRLTLINFRNRNVQLV